MSIARYARKERLQHGDQKMIAARVGVAPSVVSRVMNDKVDELSPETVQKVRAAIARKLRMSVGELFPPMEGAA